MMSKDSEALYEFAHWLSEKGREAREELVYKQYTPWIDDGLLAVSKHTTRHTSIAGRC